MSAGELMAALRKLAGRQSVWAPEFYRFPRCADVMFAEAASWSWPIRFAGAVGGHAAALDVAKSARRAKVRRLVFAHVGRPALRALTAAKRFPSASSERRSMSTDKLQMGLSLLAAAAIGAVLTWVLQRIQAPRELSRGADVTDPSIPPSESSATRLRDQPGFAQEDADQESHAS